MAGSCKRALQTLISIYYSLWRLPHSISVNRPWNCSQRDWSGLIISRFSRHLHWIVSIVSFYSLYSQNYRVNCSSDSWPRLSVGRATLTASTFDFAPKSIRNEAPIIPWNTLCGPRNHRRVHPSVSRDTMHFDELCGRLCGPRKSASTSSYARP